MSSPFESIKSIVYRNLEAFCTCEGNTLKLVCDDKIPFVDEFFTACKEIVYLPGEKITREDLMDADLLLVRTITTVDETLLQYSNIKWVGSATTGTDHIDQIWLSKNHIAFSDAAGANTDAVLEYVLCCVDGLKKQHYFAEKNLVAGVIGVGRIGRLVAESLKTGKFDVLCYDPFLFEKSTFDFVSLKTLLSESHFITLHTPLTQTGLFPTFHMLNKNELSLLKKNCILLNTARGAVINQNALLENNHITICLDVWENEPYISLELLQKVIIGTPHIAGYSLDAKYRATKMVYNAAAEFFGWGESNNAAQFENATPAHYDPLAHTQQFRNAFQNLDNPGDIDTIFIEQREQYAFR